MYCSLDVIELGYKKQDLSVMSSFDWVNSGPSAYRPPWVHQHWSTWESQAWTSLSSASCYQFILVNTSSSSAVLSRSQYGPVKSLSSTDMTSVAPTSDDPCKMTWIPTRVEIETLSKSMSRICTAIHRVTYHADLWVDLCDQNILTPVIKTHGLLVRSTGCPEFVPKDLPSVPNPSQTWLGLASFPFANFSENAYSQPCPQLPYLCWLRVYTIALINEQYLDIRSNSENCTKRIPSEWLRKAPRFASFSSC